MANQRQQLDPQSFDAALESLKLKLAYRIDQKGAGTMASNHEILGIIRQETTEYEDEIHLRGTDGAKVEELLDIAVAAIFGIASITSGGVDW